MTTQPRTCGNCDWCRKLANKSGVQVIKTEPVLICYHNPPQPCLTPMGLTGLRPPVKTSDPACSKWSAMRE